MLAKGSTHLLRKDASDIANFKLSLHHTPGTHCLSSGLLSCSWQKLLHADGKPFCCLRRRLQHYGINISSH